MKWKISLEKSIIQKWILSYELAKFYNLPSLKATKNKISDDLSVALTGKLKWS